MGNYNSFKFGVCGKKSNIISFFEYMKNQATDIEPEEFIINDIGDIFEFILYAPNYAENKDSHFSMYHKSYGVSPNWKTCSEDEIVQFVSSGCYQGYSSFDLDFLGLMEDCAAEFPGLELCGITMYEGDSNELDMTYGFFYSPANSSECLSDVIPFFVDIYCVDYGVIKAWYGASFDYLNNYLCVNEPVETEDDEDYEFRCISEEEFDSIRVDDEKLNKFLLEMEEKTNQHFIETYGHDLKYFFRELLNSEYPYKEFCLCDELASLLSE